MINSETFFSVTGFGLWIVTAVCLGILVVLLIAFASFRFYKYLMGFVGKLLLLLLLFFFVIVQFQKF